MGLNIIDNTEVRQRTSKMMDDGTYSTAQGGTELMNAKLYERVDNALLDEFFIIKSRVRKIDNSKKNVLWLHDLWSDPEVKKLSDKSFRDQFAKLIFVSNWQFQTSNLAHGVPYSESFILKNAIDPIEKKEKGKDQIRLIYHTTPHRGLALLIPVMEELAKHYGDKIHLDIYSSFEAYGWPERDEPYLDLFQRAKNNPQMTYHGFQPNHVIREALQNAHIFAYPCIWQETSCIAAIEAISAGCEVVCPNYAALPETTAGFGRTYQWNEDPNYHANVFVNILHQTIENYWNDENQNKLNFAKNYIDNFYNWDVRAIEWTAVLQSLLKKS